MGYWENRQAQAMYEYMEDAEKVSHEIADIYAKASTHISLKIDRIYKKFKDKNNLTDKDAIKLLNTLKDRTDIGELKKALKKSQNTALLAEMESGAYRARIERLEQLQIEIDKIMEQIFNQEKKIATSHYIDLATNSYYREIYNVQRQVGFQFSFSTVDPEAVNMLLKSKWSGLNYSERIWKNTQNLAKDLKEQMIIGLLTGKRQEEMAREIAIRYATGAFEARRLVRTESNFVNGQMQMAAYEECGAERYEFVATLDLRTSAQCRELDGQVFLVKDAMPGKNMNPMHPFCRSTTIIHMGDEVIAGLQRRARNPITGKNELVPADMNYKMWYQKNVNNNPKAQVAEKAMRNRETDKVQYEKYRRIYGKKVVGLSLDAFQKLKYNNTEKWEEIKAGKQETINSLSEKKIKMLNGMLDNKETRLWYKHMDEQIPDIVSKIKSLEDQAKKAHELRNKYRTQARDLMKDQKARAELDRDHPNLTWEQILEKKKERYGLTGDAAYADIVRSSATTNKKFDEKAGIK